MDERVKVALVQDETIDITTTGRKSGQPRRIETWYRRVDGRFYLTGTPGPRDWYANLLANPEFVFHLKQSTQADLPARAHAITEPEERRRIFSDPSMVWYHEQVGGVEPLVEGSPLMEVIFEEL